ncbi:hypothetical protein [Enterovibrio coralii]|uniref:Uncharacterized protein n=1 Tax=Enterovibrio coralii TaxID=294935 RepID=A0A135IBW3_9GAMM|nr:hypothetical protein [Enterovibrio coralii]KXF82834.1 hypothetical protein ATN88_23455 [Enterovibrio coralii]
MEEQQKALLDLLTKECDAYCLIPESELDLKRDKKHFINGLMTASRVVGISYEELNKIIENMPASKFSSLEEKLAIPAYLRNNVDIKFKK